MINSYFACSEILMIRKLIEEFVSFLVHFPMYAEDSSPTSPSGSSEKPSRSLPGTLQRSRWRKSKPWSPATTIKRKHPKSTVRQGEAKWYLETISTINPTNDVNNNNEEIDHPSPTTDQATPKLGKSINEDARDLIVFILF